MDRILAGHKAQGAPIGGLTTVKYEHGGLESHSGLITVTVTVLNLLYA